jgi:hypothetical protein
MGTLFGLLLAIALVAVLVLAIRLARLRKRYAAIVDVDTEVARLKQQAREDIARDREDVVRLQRAAEDAMTRAVELRVRENVDRRSER